jgi:surfactin synthase thioesterase subunit
MPDELNRWLNVIKRKNDCKFRIFCLPYAGSGASLYSVWENYFGDDVEICAVQLPGRENRRKEPLCSDINEIASKVAGVIASMADKPFAVFGYSMGGVIAYRTVLELEKKHGISPKVLFMGASSIFSDREEKVSELKEDTLISYLMSIGGTSDDTFSSEQYRKAFLPIIRNDYLLLEKAAGMFERVGCPIVSFASEEDKAMPYRNIRLLRFMTDDWTVHKMTGNHFFIHNKLRNITDIIKETIA